MLSHFETPPVVVCILCHGTVSMRKGDKTRFLNHISQDHEVHYDLEFFFALSHMTEFDKNAVVEVIRRRTDHNYNNENLIDHSIEDEDSDAYAPSDTLAEEIVDAQSSKVRVMNDDPRTRSKDTEENNPETEVASESIVETPEDFTISPLKMTASSSASSVKVTNKNRHTRTTSCQFCEKSMRKKSMNRPPHSQEHSVGKIFQ